MANPTGTLNVYLDDTNTLLTQIVLDGTNNTQNWTMPTGSIAVGGHNLIVAYSGDSNFNSGQSDPAPFTVTQFQKQNIAIGVSLTPTSQMQGQSVAVAITLTPQ